MFPFKVKSEELLRTEGVASLIAWKHPFLQSDFAVFCYLAAQVEKVMARKARLLTGQAAPFWQGLAALRRSPGLILTTRCPLYRCAC